MMHRYRVWRVRWNIWSLRRYDRKCLKWLKATREACAVNNETTGE